MSRTLTAQDRSSLIRLASSLPLGSPERKAILAGLSRSGSDENAGIAYTSFESWWGKNRSEIEGLNSAWVTKLPQGFRLSLSVGKNRGLDIDATKESAPGFFGPFHVSWDDGTFPGTAKIENAEYAAEAGTLTPKLVEEALDRVLAIARAYETRKPKLETRKGPEGEIQYYMGNKFIGEVWKGLDRKWHNSKNTHLVFRAREDAKADLLGNGSSGKGSPAPIFE